MVDIGVLPPVVQVRLVVIVHHQPVPEKDTEALRRQPVVLLDLGGPLRQIVNHVVDGVAQGHLHQGMVREDARDLAPERLVHAVIVVGVQEPALLEPATQDAHLVVREAHVAMPRDVEVRDIPQLRTRERHHALPLGDGQRGALANRGEEVGERRGTRVPIAAAIVMQSTDGKRGELVGG